MDSPTVPPTGRQRTSGAPDPDATKRSLELVESLMAPSAILAYARFSSEGVLRGANDRFLRMCDARVGVTRLDEIVAEGQRGEMLRIVHGDDLPSEARNVHFADGTLAPTTLLVTWVRDGDELLLVGEPPMADLEATQAMLVKLNGRVSDLARENAKKSAQLERALDDLRQAQAMLVHREKMAALGQVTAGVAHELNNPLAYVRNNLYLLGEGYESLLGLLNLFGDNLDAVEKSSPELFEEIMHRIETMDLPRLEERIPALLASVDDGVERASKLVAGLRTFSRLDEADFKTVDLNESMRSVVEFAGFLATENGAHITTSFGDLPPVTCSPGQLNQAVLNILTNAIQSSAPGGNVELATALDGDEVLISISDDGPGVPQGLVDRIFDPFFTTRDVGEGTGLGLSIAHTVVASHGGSIAVETAPGGGARFIIRLPLEQGAAS